MKLISVKENKITLELLRREFRMLLFASLDGKHIPNMDLYEINWTIRDSEKLYDEMISHRKFIKSNKTLYSFSKREFIFLIQAHILTMQQWGSDEYFKVIGREWNEAKKLLEDLNEIFKTIPGEKSNYKLDQVM